MSTAIGTEVAFWNEVVNQQSVEQMYINMEVAYSADECRDLIRKGL